MLLVDDPERGDGRRGGERVAAERRAVVADQEDRGGLADEHRADRDAAAEPLGQRRDIRSDRRLLEGEERAGAPDPGLDLVEDQERAGRIGQRLGQPQGTHRSSGWMPDSPWIGSSRIAAVRSVTAARSASTSLIGTWRKPSGRGANGSWYFGWPVAASEPSVRPWKEPVERDDLERSTLLPGTPGELDGGLVGLRAGVGEEDAVERRAVDQRLGQLQLRQRVVQVRGRQQRPRLLGERIGDGGVGVAEHVDRDPGDEVEVAIPGVVPDPAAFAADDDERLAGVGADVDARLLLDGGARRGGRRVRHGRSWDIYVYTIGAGASADFLSGA